MTAALALVCGALLGTSIAFATTSWRLWQARQRTYDYAVSRADFTPAGRAYSDMATVIVLDGKVQVTPQ